MERIPDRVDQAIWSVAATSHWFANAIPDILELLSIWASKALGKAVKAELFGSAVTGITDTSSDIDIVLTLLDSNADAGDVLTSLYEARCMLPAFQVVRFVPSARAPVLTIARADGISVDLTANNPLPVFNSALLKEYCGLDGRLRPLACTVKRFAKAADVVGAAGKNLSSYAWSLLAVFYLQAADLQRYLPDTADTRNLASLQAEHKSQKVRIQERYFDIGFKRLADMTRSESIEFSHCGMDNAFPWRALVLGFFKFYSQDVDLNGMVLSVRRGQAVPMKNAGPGPHIEDPFDPEHELGAVLSETRREAFLQALRWGRMVLEEEGSTFAELLEGHEDLRSPVVWDTLLHSEELEHHRVRPQGSVCVPPEAYSNCFSQDLTALLGHQLDEFQSRAIFCASRGESVIVAAPTSSGKTVVAEAALMQALCKDRSAIFCSPTKALSNQKFVDFQQKFRSKVGLLTGDVSIARDAPILVATTEVLRSMLDRGVEFDHLQSVIFDEVHYLGDSERGSVWEETMILLPANVNVLCLSATVPNALDLAGWICQTRHSVCHLLVKRTRPTPLRTYGVADVTRLLLDGHNEFMKENLEAFVPFGDRSQQDIFESIATNAKMTPALTFMFSKVACQTHALALSGRLNGARAKAVSDLIASFALPQGTSQHVQKAIEFWCLRKIQRLSGVAVLLNQESQERVVQSIQETLAHLPEVDRTLTQVTTLAHELLPYGVAFHHSGVIAPLRELVEGLCAEGLVPILFCTETCAVGLNLPAKSVAFSFIWKKGLVKRAGCAQRPVKRGEYCQMAGRAGRRGCDKQGNVLFCIGEDDNDKKDLKEKKKPDHARELASKRDTLCKNFQRVVFSAVEPITSSFVLRFPCMLSLLKFGNAGYVKWFYLQSFRQFQSRTAAGSIEQSRMQMGMFRTLEALGFVSPEQRLTILGRVAAEFRIGDPLLLAILLRDGVLEGFPSMEVVSFLSIFVAEPNFFRKEKEDLSDDDSYHHVLFSEKDLEDSFKQNIESLAGRFLDCARLLSDSYSKTGLLMTHGSKNQDYFKNWRRGCLSLPQFTRLMKDGLTMMLGIRSWLSGSSFSEVLFVAKVDPGSLAKAIRKLAKLVRDLMKAADKLAKVELAEQLLPELARLERGLPFLPSLFLGKWKSSVAESENASQLSWPSCPHEIGQVVEVKPSEVGFSHQSCSAHFQDGRTVLSTLTEILAGKVSPSDIEELRIYWHQGMYYTLGNRRLCVYRLLEHCRSNTKVLARVVSDAEAEKWDWKNKFTSGRWKGAVVLLRHTGEVIGKNSQQSTFRMPSTEDVDKIAKLPANDQLPSSPSESQPGAIAFWQQLHVACQEDECRVEQLMAVSQLPGAEMAAKLNSGPPRKLLDPLKVSDEQLAQMDMDWSPCTDARFEQPTCGDGNGKPCTRKGCRGIFEKTGEPCQFCHVHPAEVIARFEAFRGFARRAAKKNVGKHTNRRMGY